MSSTKPYLVKAVYTWACDHGYTPHVLVNTTLKNVVVPHEFIIDNRIVLNVSADATREFELTDSHIQFLANFDQCVLKVEVPMAAILAIYAQENSEGINFQEEDDETTGEVGAGHVASIATEVAKQVKRPTFKLIK